MILILVHVCFLAWISRRMFHYYSDSPIRPYYWPALALKLFSGIALGLLYFVYYGQGDTLNYQQDAAELASLGRNDFPAYLKVFLGQYPEGLELVFQQQERALFTAKIFSLFHLLTGNNYWITACYVSFLAFTALFHLSHRLSKWGPVHPRAVALAFLFWPSFVFWTSGLLKESIAIICIAYAVASVVPFLFAEKKLKGIELGFSFLLLILLFQIKYYYAGLLAPVLICLVVSVGLGRRFRLKSYWVWTLFLVLLVGGVGMATQLHPNLYMSRFMGVWVENYHLIAEASAEGGFVVYEGLVPSWQSVLKNAPKGIFTGLYEPVFRFDSANLLKMAASAENLLLLVLSLFALAGWWLKERGRLSLPTFSVLLYVLAFALIMGIAAPNYGAVIRYRISYQPFFVLLVLEGTLQVLFWFRKKEKEKS